MNQRIKKLWIKALRSGKYKQGEGYLKSTDRIKRFCCLGVLCEVYRETEGKGRWRGHYFGSQRTNVLPTTVRKWAAIDKDDPELGRTRTASELNDIGKSFNFIAGRIEKYL